MKVYIRTEDIREKTARRRVYDVRFLDPSTNREITLAYIRPEDSEVSELELENIQATRYEAIEFSEQGDIAHVKGVGLRFTSKTKWYIGQVGDEVFERLYNRISRSEDFKSNPEARGVVAFGLIEVDKSVKKEVQTLLIDVPKAKRRLKARS